MCMFTCVCFYHTDWARIAALTLKFNGSLGKFNSLSYTLQCSFPYFSPSLTLNSFRHFLSNWCPSNSLLGSHFCYGFRQDCFTFSIIFCHLISTAVSNRCINIFKNEILNYDICKHTLHYFCEIKLGWMQIISNQHSVISSSNSLVPMQMLMDKISCLLGTPILGLVGRQGL